MEPQNPDLNKRRHLEADEIPTDQATYLPRVGPPPTSDGLPVEDLPTRPMQIPGATPPRSASNSPAPWAPRANQVAWPPANPATPPPPSRTAAPPPAPGAADNGPATPASPYIPARPRSNQDTPPPHQAWVPPAQIEAIEATPARPRGAGAPSPDAPPQVAASQTRRGGVLGWIVGVTLGLIVLGLAGLFALGGWYEGQYNGRIYPGVRVLGTDLGGQTQDQARETLGAQIDAFVKQPVVLAWGDKSWQPTPEQLGLTVNLDRTIDRAFAVGREGDLPTNWQQRLDARNTGATVPLVVGMNQAALQDYLEKEVGPQINQPQVEGEVWLQGEQIHTTPAQEGRELRVYDALTAVTNGLAYLTTNRIDLPVTVTKPVVSASEVDEANRLLQTYLSGPFTGKAAGKEFKLERKDISKLITLARNMDPAAARHYTVSWNEAKMKEVAVDWSTDIDHGAQSARFDWNNGQLTVLKESEQGVELQITDTIKVLKDALNTIDKRTVDLPVKTLEPKVSSKDLDKLQIKQELGRGNSTFAGSTAARITNIRVAAGFLNGAVIAPGETFSLLDVIAPITLDRGYVEGYVIAAERTQKGIGGGTCQVSTTTFRAAFWAGLQIAERNAHAYRVGVYEAKGEPVGFDAAVFDPGVDLKIVNNTPGYVLIKTSTANDELNVWFYGTPIADEVKLVGPQISNQVDPPADIYQLDPNLPAGTKRQVETARKGLDVTIGRQVIKDGQVVSEDSFFSRFQAWPNWYLVAPGVQTPSPPRPPDPTIQN